MDAGRELDALVAEKVMGWKRAEGEIYPPSGICTSSYRARAWLMPGGQLWPEEHIPRFSTDVLAAFAVTEHIAKQKIFIRLSNITGQGKWRCAFSTGAKYANITDFCDTPSHAICLAALKALEST